MPSTIGITGASGLIGRSLASTATQRGYRVIGFSRSAGKEIPGCEVTRAFSLDAPPDFSGCDAVVHLAGESVFGLWTGEKKRRIRESRIEGTRRVVDGIRNLPGPLPVFIGGSAIGFYGDTGEGIADESSPRGDGFLAEVAAEWEAVTATAGNHAERVVMLRTSVVLASGGGALPAMRLPFLLGLGARLGRGDQWMSWIHLEDEVGLILHAIEHRELSGPLNAASPHPVRNAEFTRTLAGGMHRPAPWVLPSPLIRLALRGFSAELLENRRVTPRVALDSGYRFRWPELPAALACLLRRV